MDLKTLARSHGQRYLEAKQVRRRAGQLLSDRLRRIEDGFRTQDMSQARSSRAARMSKSYQETLLEYGALLDIERELKVRFEHCLMQIEARQSLNAFHRRRPF